MSASYSVCGLGLHANAPIAGLAGLSARTRQDVRVTLGFMPPELGLPGNASQEYFVDSELDEQGRPCMRVARLMQGRYFRLAFSDGVTVVIDSCGEQVWATWPDSSTEEDAAAYLLGSVLGFVLRLRGVTCLHASAIAIGDRAIALVGPSGSGKSSTAAGFARLGYAVMSDDIVALRELADGFRIEPAFPRIRLWPQSAESLFGSCDALPRIAPHWDKRHLELDGEGLRFQRKSLPLAAIYFLGERGDASDAPRFEGMSPVAALIGLVADNHASEFVERAQRAQEFDSLARLLETVPARRVTPDRDMARVTQLCEAIARDFREVTQAAQDG
jgi:hypothetical protein